MRLAVIDHVVVDLVRHHADIGKFLQAGDELVDLGLAGDAAGRIGRRIEDEQPRLRRDQLQRLFGGEGKAVLLADRHRDWSRPGVFDHRAVNREARIGIEDVHAGLAEHQDRHEHGRLAAGHDHHAVGRHLDLEALVQVGGNRFAERRDAVRRRVAVMAVTQRLDRGLDDELGRAEIGLADAEIDDTSLPCAASALARASTAKAFSSPMRSNAAMVFSIGMSCVSWAYLGFYCPY